MAHYNWGGCSGHKKTTAPTIWSHWYQQCFAKCIAILPDPFLGDISEDQLEARSNRHLYELKMYACMESALHLKTGHFTGTLETPDYWQWANTSFSTIKQRTLLPGSNLWKNPLKGGIIFVHDLCASIKRAGRQSSLSDVASFKRPTSHILNAFFLAFAGCKPSAVQKLSLRALLVWWQYSSEAILTNLPS